METITIFVQCLGCSLMGIICVSGYLVAVGLIVFPVIKLCRPKKMYRYILVLCGTFRQSEIQIYEYKRLTNYRTIMRSTDDTLKLTEKQNAGMDALFFDATRRFQYLP